MVEEQFRLVFCRDCGREMLIHQNTKGVYLTYLVFRRKMKIKDVLYLMRFQRVLPEKECPRCGKHALEYRGPKSLRAAIKLLRKNGGE